MILAQQMHYGATDALWRNGYTGQSMHTTNKMPSLFESRVTAIVDGIVTAGSLMAYAETSYAQPIGNRSP